MVSHANSPDSSCCPSSTFTTGRPSRSTTTTAAPLSFTSRGHVSASPGTGIQASLNDCKDTFHWAESASADSDSSDGQNGIRSVRLLYTAGLFNSSVPHNAHAFHGSSFSGISGDCALHFGVPKADKVASKPNNATVTSFNRIIGAFTGWIRFVYACRVVYQADQLSWNPTLVSSVCKPVDDWITRSVPSYSDKTKNRTELDSERSGI